MKSRSINPSVLRLLYAHSGNRCAFPDCDVPIFEDNGQLTGECCHIEAFSKNGPRYNENMSDEDINGYDNLILMCSRHHKIIDGDPISFSVDRLKEIKTNHEKNYSASTIKLTHFMMEQLQNSSKMFWGKIYSIHAEDTSDLHRDFDITLSATDLMEIVERNFDEIENFIEHFELSDNYLMADLKSLCKLTGWDFERIEQIPYYENPFYIRNWEMHNIGRPNIMKNARMHYYGMIVKILELLSAKDNSYYLLLEKWRTKFLPFQQNNYYYD